MYICMYVCMYVLCVCVRAYICMHICIYMNVCVYVHMSRSLVTCWRKRIRIPNQNLSGDQIKWEEMSGTYCTCGEDEKGLKEFDG